MGICCENFDGKENGVEKNLELEWEWECWYRSVRKWELGTHSYSHLVVAITGLPIFSSSQAKQCVLLRATAGTAIARLSHRNSVCPSVRPSVRHTGGSGKNGAS